MSHKYMLDTGIRLIFKDLNIPPQDVLRHAQLPLDLLSRKQPMITADEYLRLWQGLAYLMRDDPTLPLQLATSMTAESFSPPIFAAFCSANLNVAASRIAQYKPLIGPLRLDVTQDANQTQITFQGLPDSEDVPLPLIAGELVFFVQLARMATRERIVPRSVHTTIRIPQAEAYREFFGVPIQRDTFNGVSFHAADARRPFLTANEQMWSIFEPNLNKRMRDLDQESLFRERVRACLMETLASGQYAMSDVAAKLAVSPRTLQRRLRQEGTSFQKELDSLREELARNYLSRSDYSSGQIAFLLGYEDPNSFFRAFRSWTGETPEHVRANIQ